MNTQFPYPLYFGDSNHRTWSDYSTSVSVYSWLFVSWLLALGILSLAKHGLMFMTFPFIMMAQQLEDAKVQQVGGRLDECKYGRL